jgi:hypothetical protein
VVKLGIPGILDKESQINKSNLMGSSPKQRRGKQFIG